MKTPHLLVLPLCVILSLAADAKDLKLENPGFENDLAGWNIIKVDAGKSGLSGDAAHKGQTGLMVIDEDTENGSEVFSELLPAVPGKNYEVRFWGKNLEGSGMGVYLIFYGSDRKHLVRSKAASFTLPADAEWKEYSHEERAPEGTEFVAIRLHSYGAATVRACLDDFELVENP